VSAWSDRFADSNLVKGEKAAYLPCLLSQEDKRMLDRAALAAGLKPAVLASRLVAQVLRQNRHRYEIEAS
jgi:hypothetical protein